MGQSRTIKTSFLTKLLSKKPSSFVVMGIFVVLTIALYAVSLSHEFVLDSIQHIVNNVFVRDLNQTIQKYGFKNPRFLGYLSFALNYELVKLDPFFFQLTNILIHIANAFLVWKLGSAFLSLPLFEKTKFKQDKNWLALLLALLFLLHPLQTQAVNYIIQRFVLLVTFFYLLTFYLFTLSFLAKDKAIRNRLLIATALSIMMAFFSKETAYTLPLMLGIYYLFFIVFDLDFRKLIKYVPIVGVVLGVMWLLFDKAYDIATVFKPQLSPATGVWLNSSTYLFTQFRVLVKYIQLLILPYSQNFDYYFPPSQSLFEPLVLLSLIVLLLIISLAYFLYKQNRLLTFGIAWFFISLLVTSSIIPISDVIVEHRLYLTMFGFALTLVFSVYALVRENMEKTMIIFVPILLLYSGLTLHRNYIWRSDISLWQDVIKKAPQNLRAYNSLATSLIEDGKLNEAKSYLEDIITRNPKYVYGYNNLGTIAEKQSKLDEALMYYQKTLAIDSDNAMALHNIGSIYFKQGNSTEAAKYLDKAEQFIGNNKANANVYVNIGVAKFNEGNYEAAYQSFKTALELEPENTKALNNMGIVYAQKGDLNTAIAYFEKVLKLDPKNRDAQNNLQRALKLKEGN
ncbi:tetratricopeptide repeat protein [Candidatus Beckwithbacteria bacterium]|nr:tetratricopeptide repeat protein [Candidatus Beckwithbacteria bacterium]